MAEAMYKRSPDYFRQFQKSFRFLLFFCKPNLDKDKLLILRLHTTKKVHFVTTLLFITMF